MTVTELPTSTVDPSQFRISRDRRVLWLSGEHDIANAPMLNDVLTHMAESVRWGDLVVDLSGVEFMSASTIGALVSIERRLRFDARRLVLRAPSMCARRLVELCRLGRLVAVADAA